MALSVCSPFSLLLLSCSGESQAVTSKGKPSKVKGQRRGNEDGGSVHEPAYRQAGFTKYTKGKRRGECPRITLISRMEGSTDYTDFTD